MSLQIEPTFAAMEALTSEEIPKGEGWLYEPKWDGFRCLVFRSGDEVLLQSKAGQPLARYFPELVEQFLALKPKQFALDGEIVVAEGTALSFDKLLQRLHPAESRVRKLSRETPAQFISFDLLADAKGKPLAGKPLKDRRAALELFAGEHFPPGGSIRLSPSTTSYPQAEKWYNSAGAALDGIMAKRLDEPYRSGERAGMVKIKPARTADCVVGGFRYGSKTKIVGSLLLGLYDDDGLLHHVGFCSGLKAAMKQELTPKLEKLVKPPGFTGSAPGGPSRWSTERSAEWQPLKPELVAEVEWDHFTNGRFRHGTKFLRWRPDKPASKCTMDQVRLPRAGALELLES